MKDAFGVVSKEWVWNPPSAGNDPAGIAIDTGLQVARNVFNNYTGKKTTLEQRQKKMNERYTGWVRGQHNAYGGVDAANLAARAHQEKRDSFTRTKHGVFKDKKLTYKKVGKKTYRQVGMDNRRMAEVDRVYADRKNLPRGKVIVYQEGRHGLLIPGKLSAQAHHADDTHKAGAVSFNTKPVWFNHKTEGRKDWERFAAHHEVGHIAGKETGKEMMARQINDMTNRKGRRPHMVPNRLFATTAHEEGIADRHALRVTSGLGRKGKGAYEKYSGAHRGSKHYWAGRKDDSRDDAFGVKKRWNPVKVAALESAATKGSPYSFWTKKGKATLKARNYARAELGARESQRPEWREAGRSLRLAARKEVA